MFLAHFNSERLAFSCMNAADTAEIFAALSTWEVVQWVSFLPWPFLRADAETLVQRAEADWEHDQAWTFTVRDRDTMAFIGSTALLCLPNVQPLQTLEVGYWLAKPAWGKGYGKEVAQTLAQQAKALGVQSLYATVAQSNLASQKVLASIGLACTHEKTMLTARGDLRPSFVFEGSL
jgi:RimJ/RimL family protein N-acetyltransferase